MEKERNYEIRLHKSVWLSCWFHIDHEALVSLFTESMFSGGWNDIYLKLYSDSNLLAYKKQGDREAKVQILMKVWFILITI